MMAPIYRTAIDKVKRLGKPKKKLLVILGAGSSVEMGMPSVSTIDSLMKTWSANWAKETPNPDYFETVWQRVDAYLSSGARSGAPSINFERVLGEMVALMNWVMPAPYGNAL